MPAPDSPAWIAMWYDQFGDSYLAHSGHRDAFVLERLHDLGERLGNSESRVLDLACGAGVPATQWLAGRYVVTGIDVSSGQIERASQNVPGATFVHEDMNAIVFPAETFHAVVCLYGLPYLTAPAQQDILDRVAQWLKPGGVFLGNWLVESADMDSDFGGPIPDKQTALLMCEAAGLTVMQDWDQAGSELWTWVLARR